MVIYNHQLFIALSIVCIESSRKCKQRGKVRSYNMGHSKFVESINTVIIVHCYNLAKDFACKQITGFMNGIEMLLADNKILSFASIKN
jgi:hypothetical protein